MIEIISTPNQEANKMLFDEETPEDVEMMEDEEEVDDESNSDTN